MTEQTAEHKLSAEEVSRARTELLRRLQAMEQAKKVLAAQGEESEPSRPASSDEDTEKRLGKAFRNMGC